MKARTDPSSSNGEEKLSLDHPLVLAALEEHLEAIQSGKRVNRQALLNQFPEIASELQDCLEGMEFLCPPDDESGTQIITRGLTEQLGDFRLLREIGRGGMGVVYEAEQISLGRHVALKVLPFAATLDSRQLQRFKQEAQAAACLNHPHIVPIYAVGQEEGVHFYAMQLIDGQTLAEPIRQLRRASGADLTFTKPPEPALENGELPPTVAQPHPHSESVDIAIENEPPRESISLLGTSHFRHIAKLGKQAAEALDHAHQLGVVHRDIKPANLLLDSRGELWVTDFGLALLETQAELTATGDLVGTLRYMSPEQAQAHRGIVDHRTDIYSLGATLYELLTLEPVHDGETTQEMLEQVISKEPRPLRAWNRAIPADLETIILKALAKRPEDRYSTAAAMAEDLDRFLHDRPIQARRPSLPTRMFRWSRRHRGLVTAGITLLLLASLGLAVSTWLIWREQAKTEQAYEGEAAQRRVAEANFEQARNMLDFFTEVTETELAEYPEAQEVRRKLLEASLRYYRDFINRAKDNPAMLEELSDTHFRIATILDQMGEDKRAEAAFTKAFDLGHRLLRSRPDDKQLREDLAQKYQLWGWMRTDDIIRQMAKESVQKELKVTPEQKKQIDGLYQKHNNFFQTNRGRIRGDYQKSRAQFDQVRKQTANQLSALLTSEQKTRLEQIALQQRGIFAFRDKRVQQSLKLTAEQQKQIEELLAPRQNRRWSQTQMRELGQSVLKVLTTEQAATWNKMKGERFVDPNRRGRPGFSGMSRFRSGPRFGPGQ